METSLHSVPFGNVFINKQGYACVKGGPLDNSKFLVLLTNSDGIIKGFCYMDGDSTVTITDDVIVVIPKSVADTMQRLEHPRE